MPKQGTRAEVNTFVQGLITEASPLNFPPNASLDECNFDLNRNGTRDRRLGIDLEVAHQDVEGYLSLASIDTYKYNTFRWYSVNGLQDRDFLVVQVGTYLHFFNLNVASLSSQGYISSMALTSFVATDRFSFAALEGKLVVVCGAVAPVAVITFNPSSNTLSVEYKRLLVRDLWGVEDSGQYETDKTYRGAETAPHWYNLYNQSWGVPRKNKTGVEDDPVHIYNADKGVYPSNSETVWAGLQFQGIVGGADPFERIFPNLWDDARNGGTSASKGYFIIDLLSRGASRIDQVAINKAKYPALNYGTFYTVGDITTQGASVVCEFAGRLFYAGFNGDLIDGDKRSPSLKNTVVFSQLVRNIQDIVKCYQEGDPTSRDESDVVDTDGGHVRVSGADKIVALANIGSHLIVMASNGVWALSGGSDYGFTATNFKVTKLSNFGCTSPNSLVQEGGRLFFWNEDGIYALAKDKYGELSVESISRTTIQTLYDNIPESSKLEAVGTYDQYSKKIRWLYREGARFTEHSVTKELIFDTTIGSFYIHTIGRLESNDVEILSVFCGNELPKPSIRDSGAFSVRYLVAIRRPGTAYMGFAYHRDEDFLDWKTVDGIGVDAKGYIVTGENIVGDSSVMKQVPYLVMHFKRTEDEVQDLVPIHQSGCKVRSMWDWSNSINSNKWSPLFQAYRYHKANFISGDGAYDTGFKTVVTKNKIRGRGRAFSFYMETEPLKDCRILGWNLTINGNSLA